MNETMHYTSSHQLNDTLTKLQTDCCALSRDRVALMDDRSFGTNGFSLTTDSVALSKDIE